MDGSLWPPEAPPKLQALRARLYALFAPPAELRLADWAEASIVLPPALSVRPGPYRNWPYLTAIFDSIGGDEADQVTVIKPIQVGYTIGLTIALGARIKIRPGEPTGMLVPRDDDARDYMTDYIEPIFAATPALRGMAIEGRLKGRNTMTRKRFQGGTTLRILSARSPRNLRRHSLKILYCDEIDAMEVTPEGDPLALAEGRTFAHADRKIVRGSTPTDEETSAIARAYAESDQRIFELACPHCHDWFELLWEHIQWPQGEPEKATCYCPHCGGEVEERLKPALVAAGRWRATRPEIRGHHGYRLNALISLLPNAAWGKLAARFEKARRGGPAELQVFVNQILGKTWKTTLGNLSAETLAGRVEPIGLERIPPEIVLLTCGADVQNDRIEACVLGWPVSGAPAVLGRTIIDGNTLEDETWAAFDEFLRTRYRHPNGWEMRLDATAVDSGGSEGRTQMVYDFCGARLHRRVYAIAARAGSRPVWTAAKRIKSGKSAKLFIIGHDDVKTKVLDLLSQEPFIGGERNPHALRVSDELDWEWFEQATNEVRRIRYVRNRPVISFQPKRRGLPVEALDCLCYAWAVRQAPAVKAIPVRARALRRPTPTLGANDVPPPAQPRSRFANWAARFNE